MLLQQKSACIFKPIAGKLEMNFFKMIDAFLKNIH